MPEQNDAIQSDVSDEQNKAADATTTTSEAETKTEETAPETKGERPKSDRELGMEMMHARRREALAAEGLNLDAPTPETKPEVTADVDTQIEVQTKAEEKTAEAPAPTIESADPAPQMVRVKVNGVEELVPLERVIAQYQKSDSAEKRLQEATRLLEEARAQHSQAATKDEKKEAAEKIAEAQTALDGLKKQFFESIFEGDKDKAQSALDQIINESVATALKGRETATPDEASIIAKVAPAIEQSLAVRSALRTFQKEFPEIAKDPYLAARADAFLNEALAAGKAHDEAFKEAGEKTRGWMRESLGVNPQVTVATARTERTSQRKAGIDNPPSANAKTVIPETPTEQNVASTIAEMRKQRIAG